LRQIDLESAELVNHGCVPLFNVRRQICVLTPIIRVLLSF
jgi:hypothetical protein